MGLPVYCCSFLFLSYPALSICQVDYQKEFWSIPSYIWNAIDEHQTLTTSEETDYYNGTIEKFVISVYIGHFKYGGHDIRSYAVGKVNTTAMYYLCYWSILVDDNINQQNWACKFPGRSMKKTIRNRCLLDAFCPNPCCGLRKVSNTLQDCDQLEDGICSVLLRRPSKCDLKEGFATYSTRSVQEFAKSGPLFDCQCLPTEVWNSDYLTCLDEDECLTGKHRCDPKTQYCVNRLNGYFCACIWGHYPIGRFACRKRQLEDMKPFLLNASMARSPSSSISNLP